MAFSASRFTSKRATTTNGSKMDGRAADSGKGGKPRRSRSVRAGPKAASATPAVAELPNARDNPLFLMEEGPEKSCEGPEGRRGRSVVRGSGCSGGSRNGDGRTSSSRAGGGKRRRSPSRASSRNYESEVEHEQKCNLVSKSRTNVSAGFDSSDKTKFGVDSDDNEGSSIKTRDLPVPPSPDQSTETGVAGDGSPILPLRCKTSRNWGNGVSTSYFLDAEEKTIKFVCEQVKIREIDAHGICEIIRAEVRRAVLEIQSGLQNVVRNESSTVVPAADVADIPSELVNPDTLLFTSAVRRDYAVKLEQEGAKNLQAESDVEECNEVSKEFLKGTYPESQTFEEQKSHLRQKTRVKPRNMSRRSTEEALNYFDECTSISTFDSADFSSLDDPPSSSFVAPHDSNGIACGSGMSGYSFVNSLDDQHIHNKESDSPCSLNFSVTDSTANSILGSIKEDDIFTQDGEVQDDHVDSPMSPRNNTFYSSSEADDIRQLARRFQRRMNKDVTKKSIVGKEYNPNDNALKMSAETLLCEKVILRNRIDSGGLLLCNPRTG